VDKVWIEKLPETKEPEGAKRWVEEKGEFVQISYGEEIWHLALFELKAGYWRGRHYHERKDESFYVVRGAIRAVCMDMDSGLKEEYMIGPGDKMRIRPRCGHIFYGLEDALVVEYSPQKYDKGDAFKVEFEERS
jgi:mannose-6-phosphate isomerase-like protein (cupin superfamily)